MKERTAGVVKQATYTMHYTRRSQRGGSQTKTNPTHMVIFNTNKYREVFCFLFFGVLVYLYLASWKGMPD